MELHKQQSTFSTMSAQSHSGSQGQHHIRSATPMSTVSFISYRSNDHHDGHSGRSTPIHEATDLDDSRSYCSASDMSRSIWEPPVELQRASIAFSDADAYTLFFPLELTNKDYLRRVLEIAAMGVRTRVMQITSELRLRPIKNESDHDIYYLLKQVLGRNIDWHSEEDRDNQEKAIQQMFADRLYCPPEKLFEAARHLYETRNHLFHMERDIGSKFDILKSFEAAHSLLDCFGATASHALVQVHALEVQFARHHQFRSKRIWQLGWAPPEPHHSPQHAEDTTREELISAVLKLSKRIDLLLQPAPAAHTIAIARLVGIREDLQHHIHIIYEEKKDGKEAQRLERLVAGIDSILSVRIEHDTATGATNGAGGTASSGIGALLPHEQKTKQQQQQPEWEIGRGFARLDNAASLCREVDDVIAALHKLAAHTQLQHHQPASLPAVTANGTSSIDPSTVEAHRDIIDELVRKKDALKTLTIPLSQFHNLPGNTTTLTLTGRHIWFAHHNDSFSLASIATNPSCLYIVKIVCTDIHWVEHRYYDLCLNYESLSLRVPALRELKRAGFTVEELAASLFLPADLRAAGYTAKELMQVGCTLRVLKDAGYMVSELNTAGYGLSALRKIGFSANIMRDAGYSAADLHAAGFTVADLKAAWYSATALRHAGFALRDVVAAGYTAAETKKAGYSASALRAVGFSAVDLRLAGFGVSALRAAGFVPPDLRLAGFTVSDMRAAAAGGGGGGGGGTGFSAVYMREAGFPVEEILTAGFSKSELEAAELIAAATAPPPPLAAAAATVLSNHSIAASSSVSPPPSPLAAAATVLSSSIAASFSVSVTVEAADGAAQIASITTVSASATADSSI